MGLSKRKLKTIREGKEKLKKGCSFCGSKRHKVKELNALLDEYEVKFSGDDQVNAKGWVYRLGYLELLNIVYPFNYETDLRIIRLKGEAVKALVKREID